MPFWFKLLFYYLWVSPHVLLLVTLVFLFIHKSYRQFPFFTAYVFFEIFEFAILFRVGQQHLFSEDIYRAMFAAGSAVSAILRFAVIYEVMSNLTAPYSSLQSMGRRLLQTIGVLFLALGAGLAYLHGAQSGFVSVVGMLDRTVSLLQSGLLVAVLVFSKYFAISRYNCAFGIALGFGIYEIVELAIWAVLADRGVGSYRFDAIGMAAYHAAVVIWLVWVAVPERAEGLSPAIEQALLNHNLDKWDGEVRRVIE